MARKRNKIKENILDLVQLLINSVGQENITTKDRETLEKILFYEKNRDRAVLRLAQIEDNYKGNTVFLPIKYRKKF